MQHLKVGLQPADGQVFLDHIAHWVPDAQKAADALTAMGFALTPFSEQKQTDANGALAPAGAGNRCVMLARGYLEFLTPLADTPIGQELKAGIERYIGVHIGAFAAADAERSHAHLCALGVQMRPLARLRREVLDADGEEATARFSVARPMLGQVPEGRMQFLTHHTPELLWQRRYVAHPNGATALTALLVCVTDLDAAVRRYEAMLQRPAERADGFAGIALDQGMLVLSEHHTASASLHGAPVPAAPSMVSYVIACEQLARFSSSLTSGGARLLARTADAALLELPAALGASLIATETAGDPLRTIASFG